MARNSLLDSRGYFDFSPVWGSSHWDLVCGGRGTGKTFGCKLKGCTAYLDTREQEVPTQWVYMRRTEAELQTLLRSGEFLADVNTHKRFADWDFRMSGPVMQCRRKDAPKKTPWETMGYCVALSTAGKLKGETLPSVGLIEYDEFIIEDKAMRYLPDEFDAIFRAYNTIDRNRGQAKMVFTSNACSPVNPIMSGFHIPLGTNIKTHGYYRIPNGSSYVGFYWVPPNDAYMRKVQATEAYRLREGSEFNEYAFANRFTALDDLDMVAKKPSDAQAVAYLVWGGKTYTMWYIKRVCYINEQCVNMELPRLCLLRKDMSADAVCFKRNEQLFLGLLERFRQNCVRFETPRQREELESMFEYLGMQ